MGSRNPSLLALSIVVAVLFVAGIAWAGEGGAKKAPAKGKAAAGKSGKAAGKAAAAAKQAPAKEAAPTTASKLEARLKALEAALEQATNKRGGLIPFATDNLVNFLDEGKDGLVNPESNAKIIMNAAMAGKNAKQISDPKTFITFYADKDTPNKGRAVIYASSDIAYLSADDFKKGLEASKPKVLTAAEREQARDDAIAARDARHGGKRAGD